MLQQPFVLKHKLSSRRSHSYSINVCKPNYTLKHVVGFHVLTLQLVVARANGFTSWFGAGRLWLRDQSKL